MEVPYKRATAMKTKPKRNTGLPPATHLRHFQEITDAIHPNASAADRSTLKNKYTKEEAKKLFPLKARNKFKYTNAKPPVPPRKRPRHKQRLVIPRNAVRWRLGRGSRRFFHDLRSRGILSTATRYRLFEVLLIEKNWPVNGIPNTRHADYEAALSNLQEAVDVDRCRYILRNNTLYLIRRFVLCNARK